MKKYDKILAAVLATILSLAFVFPTKAQTLGDGSILDTIQNLLQTQMSPSNQSTSGPLSQNGIDAATSNANLNIFELALRETGMDQKLSQGGPYTIFAPSDAAIKKVPESTLKNLITDTDKLNSALENHVVRGTLTSNDINNNNLKSLDGNSIKLTKSSDGTVKVNGQKVEQVQGIRFNGGTIYVIDGTIMPPNN